MRFFCIYAILVYMKRFFVDQINTSDVVLTGSEHNHLHNVLRLNVGEQVVLNCGDGFDYHATIVNTAKNSTNLHITDKVKNTVDATTQVTVFQAFVKRDNMSLIIQKCTELGVAHFYPFESKFITAKDSDGKVEKLQAIANQSTKQCRRSVPMHVHDALKFKQMLGMLRDFDVVIFANECEKSALLPNTLAGSKNVAIIVGSEGGFDKDEINAIVGAGATSVTLGRRILRAETAAIALTSVVMYLCGEWNYED